MIIPTILGEIHFEAYDLASADIAGMYLLSSYDVSSQNLITYEIESASNYLTGQTRDKSLPGNSVRLDQGPKPSLSLGT